MSIDSIDRNRLRDLYHEFDQFLASIHGLYLDACIGFRLINVNLDEKQSELIKLMGGKSSGLLSLLNFSHEKFYGGEFAASGLHRPKVADIRERTEENGRNANLVGGMCVISLYEHWDAYLQNEIAIAIGLSNKDDLKHDFWGDMRDLRNYIVHHGRRNRKKLKKMKLLTMWRDDGVVEINNEVIAIIFRHCFRFRNEIHTISLPPRPTLRIPYSWK
ncbi:hypothetical protein DND132_3293 [Pseudodesulfovibrio mercurii]|uniref:Uncharacterized protein n=1 Tax=Pseudodesulfovibrio mercurii TaxID=641491 RepID=F0JKP7_9BACT|nr:hypothetical protein [Pseudodesulfovibrio mercurii]EGB16496.1 hypothetical protein DND132_3293 [Pseudodesulfovibrio mercurii]